MIPKKIHWNLQSPGSSILTHAIRKTYVSSCCNAGKWHGHASYVVWICLLQCWGIHRGFSSQHVKKTSQPGWWNESTKQKPAEISLYILNLLKIDIGWNHWLNTQKLVAKYQSPLVTYSKLLVKYAKLLVTTTFWVVTNHHFWWFHCDFGLLPSDNQTWQCRIPQIKLDDFAISVQILVREFHNLTTSHVLVEGNTTFH